MNDGGSPELKPLPWSHPIEIQIAERVGLKQSFVFEGPAHLRAAFQQIKATIVAPFFFKP